jgi:hypothetical protein
VGPLWADNEYVAPAGTDNGRTSEKDADPSVVRGTSWSNNPYLR